MFLEVHPETNVCQERAYSVVGKAEIDCSCARPDTARGARAQQSAFAQCAVNQKETFKDYSRTGWKK